MCGVRGDTRGQGERDGQEEAGGHACACGGEGELGERWVGAWRERGDEELEFAVDEKEGGVLGHCTDNGSRQALWGVSGDGDKRRGLTR